MKILKVTFQNFKSYGNKKTVLDFEKDFNSNLVIINGINGSGKTSVREIIEFAIYGKVDGFTLADLPNRTNKNLLVYIKFISKKKTIEIERGISPAIFNLKINGKPYDEAGKKNIQQYIENELFEIPYHIFKNIIVLSINNFKSFLTMTPKDKRDIIDRIFGFDILNTMIEEIKNDKKEVDTELTQITFELNSINGTIEDLKSRLIEAKKDVNDKTDKEIKTLTNSINELSLKVKPLQTEFLDIKTKIDLTDKDLNISKNNLNKYKHELITVNKSYSLYNNNKCPECGSDLTTGIHVDKKESFKNQLLEIKDKIEKEQTIITDLNNSVFNLEKLNNKIIENKSKLESQIYLYKNKIVDLVKNSKKSEDTNINSLTSMLDTYEVKKIEKSDSQIEFSNSKNFYRKAEDILSTSGIKQMVINNVLPLLNNNIDATLKDLDTNYNVKIDKNFDCIVKSFGEEINVKTLSTGERTRVDTGIVISLIKLIKLQFPSLNVLFLDEIFSAIDLVSINSMIEMVKVLSVNLDLNIFLVSHSSIDENLFDKKIILKKVNTFSELSIEKLK